MSLSCQSIIVDRPLSCIVYVRGAPARALFALCSSSKARHSGPLSASLEATTNPQFMHTISAASGSRMSLVLPHSGHC